MFAHIKTRCSFCCISFIVGLVLYCSAILRRFGSRYCAVCGGGYELSDFFGAGIAGSKDTCYIGFAIFACHNISGLIQAYDVGEHLVLGSAPIATNTPLTSSF